MTMMATPAQIQIRYIQEEDRILMRLNTVAEEEYRFWLTHRFLIRLWPVLQDALMSSPAVKQHSDIHSRQAIIAFEHEQAQSKAQFNSPFREASNLPLGKDPLLVAKAGFRHQTNGALALSLKNVAEKGADLTLTHDLLHLLCQLLDDAAQQSEWKMSSLLPNITETHSPVAAHQLN
ncbi:hypothetical protein RCF98_07300 [Thiothrix lacustris]|jgi:hypothetical protein|uniref:Uncharacterized protein n=1 Tax=Thiothrix lacustris TaxID=525917 RepID=A0ABY9MU01_9GAMM|nr:hypothetical protein [Thiothrix lacustris]WML92141.1 hypothetical protein RCF98_07300 [Thiothrix lacustris]